MNRTAVAVASIFLCLHLYGQVPQLINYQGRVVVGSTNFNGTGQFKFALINGANGTTLWRNHGTGAGEPANAVSIAVTNGLYSVLLGDTSLTNMAAIPVTVFNNSNVQLRVWFNDGTTGSQQLTPDQRIAAVGYAIIARNVPDGAITSAKIANGAVSTTKLAAGAVQSGNIAAGAVGNSQLAANAVQSSNIAEGAITAAQLAKPPRSGVISGSSIFPPFQTGGLAVDLDPPYTSTPAITVSLRSPDPSAGSVELGSSYPFAFSFVVRHPEPVVVAETNFGFDIAMAEIDGRPAFAYIENGAIKFVRANSASGTGWLPPLTVATNASGALSLAIVNGTAAISYYGGAQDLMYVRSNNTSGSSWGAPVPVATSGDVGRYNSLYLIPSGNPAIAYYDATNKKLMFVRATDASGTMWGVPVIVDNRPLDVGQYAILKSLSIYPTISYYENTNGDFYYVQAEDADGTSWPAPALVDATGDVGRFGTFMQGSVGLPVFCYNDTTNGDLKWARQTGPGQYEYITLDSSGLATRGVKPSMANINNLPTIAYINNFPLFVSDPPGDLKIVRATNFEGTAWSTPTTLETALPIPQVVLHRFANGGAAIGLCSLRSGGSYVKFRRLLMDYDVHWIALPP